MRTAFPHVEIHAIFASVLQWVRFVLDQCADAKAGHTHTHTHTHARTHTHTHTHTHTPR
jgi:hypothetical protein